MYPVTLRLIQKCFIPTYKWSMEISTYPVTLILRLYQKFLTERVHGNFRVSCNIETNIIQKCFTERVHGNFHVSSNIETNSEILYQKGPWKFLCTVPSNIKTHSKMFLLKGSMEISMYPVILRLTHKFFEERVHENVRVPVTSRLIQKFVTERVHVSCHIEFNLKKLLPKGSMEISLYL